MVVERRLVGSVMVSWLLTLVHSTIGPMWPNAEDTLAGRQIRSSCEADQKREGDTGVRGGQGRQDFRYRAGKLKECGVCWRDQALLRHLASLPLSCFTGRP